MKSFAVILALCVLAIALPIDPRISLLLVLGLVGGSIAVKLGKTAGFVAGAVLLAAAGYAMRV
mgnify:FL=1